MAIKKVSIYGLLVIISLLISGEFFSKFYLGLGTPPLSVQHPTIEYMFKPDQDVYRFGNHFVTNEYGMRTEPFSKEKTQNELRILAFGDSVLNGGNLTNQEELATTLLKEDLSEVLEKNVVVGNISAGSWGPGNWLAYVQEYGFFDADIVVLVISSHDSGDNPSFQPLNESTHPTRRPPSALLEGAFKYLPRYLPKLGKKLGENESGDTSLIVNEQDISKALGDLESFLQLAQNHSDYLLVVQHWEKAEIDNKSATSGNQRIKELCNQLGIRTVSLQPYFQQAIDDGIEPYRDNIHPNQAGQKLIEDAILENIPKNLLTE